MYTGATVTCVHAPDGFRNGPKRGPEEIKRPPMAAFRCPLLRVRWLRLAWIRAAN